MAWVKKSRLEALDKRLDAVEYEILKLREVRRKDDEAENAEAAYLTKDGTYSISRFRARRKGRIDE